MRPKHRRGSKKHTQPHWYSGHWQRGRERRNYEKVCSGQLVADCLLARRIFLHCGNEPDSIQLFSKCQLDKQNVATINFIWEFFCGAARAGSSERFKAIWASNSFSWRTVRPRGAVGLQGPKLYSFCDSRPPNCLGSNLPRTRRGKLGPMPWHLDPGGVCCSGGPKRFDPGKLQLHNTGCFFFIGH